MHRAHALFVLAAVALTASAQVRKVREPAGKTIDKAEAKAQLIWPGAKPFHVKLQISQAKGDPGEYQATVEEFWLSPNQWTRTVTGPSVRETVWQDASGTHYNTSGDYFPLWLANFVTGLLTPLPDLEAWDHSKPYIEYIVLPNGVESEHCAHHEFMLGTPANEQINFANICFDKQGMINMEQSPNYTVSFGDYAPFGKQRIARKLGVEVNQRVQLIGKVTVLEAIPNDPSKLPAPPADGASQDPFSFVGISADNMLKLAGGVPSFQWPNPIPGHGRFTVWIAVDKAGRIREEQPLNSDESGIAAEMSAQLLGRQWKAPRLSTGAIQVDGPLVISYPPVP